MKKTTMLFFALIMGALNFAHAFNFSAERIEMACTKKCSVEMDRVTVDAECYDECSYYMRSGCNYYSDESCCISCNPLDEFCSCYSDY